MPVSTRDTDGFKSHLDNLDGDDDNSQILLRYKWHALDAAFIVDGVYNRRVNL
jgi:hypothetical protein